MIAPVDPRAALLAGLEAAALAAEQAERSFKREIDQRIAALERDRAFAHRRLRLIAAMAAAGPAEDRAAGARARVAAGFAHIGWPTTEADLDPTEHEVRAALQPVAAALEDVVRSGRPEWAGAEEGSLPSVPAAMAAFEAWYRARFGVDFLAVFEQRAEFRPAIDF